MKINLNKILIVDDNQFYRRGLILSLNRICNVSHFLEANDGTESLDLVRANQPDLIFMDIKMPIMGGIAATKEAIAINHRFKIIALTMFFNKAYLREMILAGAKGFLIKDFDREELKMAIERVLAGKNYYAKKAIDYASF